MAKFYQITRHWVQKVSDYNELPTGKVYYTVDGKKYHPANKHDFIEAAPEDFDFSSGSLYHLKDPRPLNL